MEPYQLVCIGGSGLFLAHELLRNRVGIRLPDDLVYVDDDQSREPGVYNHFHSLLSAAERAGVELRLLKPLEPDLLRSAGVSSPRIADAWRDPSSMLLGSLFTRTELDTGLRNGFFADPKLGASCCIASNTLDHLSNEIQGFGGRPERGIRHRILAGSVGGGTGAGILPALARRLRPAAYAPHYDGRHLSVLAFLPWMNPDKAAAIAEGPIRPTWQGCARNAVGGLRSLQRLVFDVQQQNGRHAAGAGQPVETFVYPLGVAVVEAEAKAPPTVAEVRSRGSADDLFLHAVLALPGLLAARAGQVPPGGAYFAALHSPLLPSDARAADGLSPISEVDAGMWRALEQMGGNPDRKTRGWVLERAGLFTISTYALPGPLFRIVKRASESFKRDAVEVFFGKIKARWTERARQLEAWVKKYPPRLEPNLSRFGDDAVLRRAIEEQLDGKTTEMLCRCADCDGAGEPTQTANAEHIADVIADAVRQYFLVRASEANGRRPAGGARVIGGRILPLPAPAEAVAADACGRSLLQPPAGGGPAAADLLAAVYAGGTGEPGVYSRPFASPLGIAHATLHCVRDALQEHRDRTRLLSERGVSLVIALWRAAFHNLLAFDAITPRDREILAAGEPAAILADCRVVRFGSAAIGLTFPELGLVPHVELVDQERSAEGRERLQMTLACQSLLTQLSKMDEMPDRIAFRRYLDDLRPELDLALAALPVGQRQLPIWYQLLDRWTGHDLLAETAIHCARRVALWPSQAGPLAPFQHIPVRRGAISVFTTSDGTLWQAPGVVADHLGDGHTELELEVVRYEMGRVLCAPAWAGDGREVEMPFLPGVCAASRAADPPAGQVIDAVPRDVRHAMYVWDEHAHAVWDGSARVLRLVGRIEGRTEIYTFAVHFGPAFAVEALSSERVLAKRVPRVRAFEQGREGWVYADVPVRAEFLHLVRDAKVAVGPAGRVYTIAFLGGVTREAVYGEGQAADVGRPTAHGNSRKTVPIAVWPGLGMPAAIRREWRLYTFLLGDNGLVDVNGEYKVSFGIYGGMPGRDPVFRKLDRTGDVAAVRTVLGPPVPRFVHLTHLGEAGGEGAFLLDPLHEAAGSDAPLPAAAYVGLDLGTSNTCLAATRGQAAELLQLAGEPAHRPHVIARNAGSEVELGLVTSEPWLPSVRCGQDSPDRRPAVTPFSELPTCVLMTSRYAAEGGTVPDDSIRKEGMLPFEDHCLVGPEVNIANWGPRVLSAIKWGHSPEKTSRFLEALLVWGLASDKTYAKDVILRASFPLAFRPDARAGYGVVLAQALQRAAAWTGRKARLDAPLDAPVGDEVPGAHASEADPPLPFLDESSVLVEGIGKTFRHHGHATKDGGRTLAIAAAIDIGGGTVDTVIAALKSGSGDGLNSRLLSAGSVELGADVLKRHLRESIFRMSFPSILDLEIRAGLPRRIWSTEGWGRGGDQLTTVAQATESLPQAWLLLRSYFGILAEYCARVLAGALLDRPNLIHRLKSARGTGAQGAFDPEISWLSEADGPVRVVLAPLLCGNGWGWLPAAERAAWTSLFAGRARELLSSYDTRSRKGGTWAPFDPSVVLLDATTWPKGKVATLLAGVQRLTRNPTPVPPESVCNGFAVEPGHEERWIRQIGAGAIPASNTAAQAWYGGLWSRCDPPNAVAAPPFPRQVTLGALTQIELVSRPWELPTAAEFVDIRRAQAERKDQAEFRSLSTMDAWLGRVLAPALDDQWLR